jgi:hypothetical protein
LVANDAALKKRWMCVLDLFEAEFKKSSTSPSAATEDARRRRRRGGLRITSVLIRSRDRGTGIPNVSPLVHQFSEEDRS